MADGRSVTVAELVARLGPPQKVGAFADGGEDAHIVAQLYYIRWGFEIFARRPIDAKSEITPEMIVDRFDLFQSRTMAGITPEMIQEWGSTGLTEAEDWKGFGAIKVQR